MSQRLQIAFAAALVGASVVPATALADEIPAAALIGDLGLHVIGVGHHQTLSSYLAGQLLLDLYAPWTQNAHLLGPEGEPEADVLGVVVRARVFLHPFGNAPRGLWVSPFTQLGPVWATRDGEKRTGAAGATGLSVGYSLWIAGHVLVGLGAGAQYHAAALPGGDGTPSFAGLYPTVDILLGYAF
jgi:hypothetical protein